MKRLVHILWSIAILALILFASCKGDEKDDFVPTYLVDNEVFTPALPATANNIKVLMNNFGVNALANEIKYDVKIHKIIYKTLFEGDSILVSGIVATPIPDKKNEKFPIMSYQHGTIFKKSEAPSVNTNEEYMVYMASTGMVVAIADYIGFGASSPEFHPYLNKQYTVNAVLDMIRATKEFIIVEEPCKINDLLFLFGYSQGGGATIAAMDAIENNPANSDLKVNAVSAGSGVYDIGTFRRWIMNQQRYQKPSFVAYLLESFLTYTNMSVSYDMVFKEQYANKVPGLIDGLKTEDQINKELGSEHVGGLFNTDFANNITFPTNPDYQSMREAFDNNKISGWLTNTPMKLFYGTDDLWVPGEQTMELFKEFRNAGTGSNTIMTPISGADHLTATPQILFETIVWFKSLNN